ncbi:MAG TPA: phenylalanine--tRNA ligase subunit beta [Nevskiaceae bacterium]
MKISERWLRTWVNPPDDIAALARRLDMAGHECSYAPVVEPLAQGVVVARITSVSPHPDSTHLHVCEVEHTQGGSATVVCGAPNVRAGMVSGFALPGARLPADRSIERTKIRGVESAGMLCSPAELGFSDDAAGIIELDPDAPLGTDIVEYLGLDDHVLDLEITPNRGDCLSVAGLARETAAIYGLQQTTVLPSPVPPTEATTSHALAIEDGEGCPHYVGRVIRDIDPHRRTPDWMRERLNRAGIRSIYPLVDITNYLMVELGQPMHAFDSTAVDGTIRVRRAQPGEVLELLDGQQLTLTADDMVIADDAHALALAGIKGGRHSGITADTRQVFLESACFDPITIAKTGRRHKLITDARYRYERGVDPGLQRRALERATGLVVQICGGRPEPVVEVGSSGNARRVALRQASITRLLGCDIPIRDVPPMLERLGIQLHATGEGEWQATVPTFRYDIEREADLVEEVGRLYGYDRIPARAAAIAIDPHVAPETQRGMDRARATLVARGYQEIVTYSFVDRDLERALDPDASPVMLDNPIAATMAAMRTTLWCGLVSTWLYNRQRQRGDGRLFESGECFSRHGEDIVEEQRVAGLIVGSVAPRQWGQSARAPDLYDAKADVAALIGDGSEWRYEAATHPALHPGRSARILRAGKPCGWIGELHPTLCSDMGLGSPPVLFELDWDHLGPTTLPRYARLSDQPSIQRDLALEVKDEVPADALVETAMRAGIDTLREVKIFDVYSGKGLKNGHKSVALSLVFQDTSRTLEDESVDAAIVVIATKLRSTLGAIVRGG